MRYAALMLSIKTLKSIQRDLGLGSNHVVYLGEKGFAIAHTDEERACKTPLHECGLHLYLCCMESPPRLPGLYRVVANEHGWNWERLKL